MSRIQVPYGKTYQEAEIEDSIPVQLIDPECAPVTESVDTLIEQALDHPIASEKLENIVTKQDMPLIIVNDQTRPGPNREMVEAIVRRLEKAGIPDTHMRIIIATGSHRAPTSEELDSLVGEDIHKRIAVYSHDCKKIMCILVRLKAGFQFMLISWWQKQALLLQQDWLRLIRQLVFQAGEKALFRE